MRGPRYTAISDGGWHMNLGDTEQTVKAGEILLVTQGQYSDYSCTAIMRAERDFDIAEVKALYLAEFPEQAEEYNAEHEQFVGWLSSCGYATDVPHRELHAGSYGNLEPKLFVA